MSKPDPKLEQLVMTDIFVDSEFNCRGAITPMDVIDLAKDIKVRGLIQPIVVTPYNRDGYKYKLIAGHRRYTAFQVNKETVISAIINTQLKDSVKATLFNLAENLHREDLNIVQEARAISRLVYLDLKRGEIAQQLGMSDGWVQVRCMLLELPEDIQNEVMGGLIKQSDIRTLYSVYRTGGKTATNNYVKKIKDARLLGKAPTPPKRKPKSKTHRQRQEIFNMMVHIQDLIGNSFCTRGLAWCAGEISTEDLEEDIKELCKEANVTYMEMRD